MQSLPVNHDYFAVIDTEEKAYWLGFLTADGCVSDGNKVLLALGEKDADHVERFRRAVGAEHAVKTRRMDTGYAQGTIVARLSFRSSKMVADLARLGVVPRKSKIATPWNAPPELAKHYFRGLVDGDGWLHPQKCVGGSWVVGLCGSEPIVLAFAEYATKIVGAASQPRCHRSIWKVQFSGGFKGVGLIRHLYAGATVALDRKAALAAVAIQHESKFSAPPFDWSKVAKRDLLARHARLGTWKAVAAEMGVSRNSLAILKKKYFGLTDRTHTNKRDWSTVTYASLTAMRDRLGSWVAVANEFGTTNRNLFAVMQYRFGHPRCS